VSIITSKRLASSIEEYLEAVASKMLELHDYALSATVSSRTVYYVELEWNDIKGREPVEAVITVAKHRSGERLWIVQVTSYVITVCPSALDFISRNLLNVRELAPSHTQKVRLTGRIHTRGILVRIEDVARALALSGSAPTFTKLKRVEEAKLIVEAFRNPKFIEDVVRDALCNLYRVARNYGVRDGVIEVEAESYESIHPHNVYAYRRASITELNNEVGSCGVSS